MASVEIARCRDVRFFESPFNHERLERSCVKAFRAEPSSSASLRHAFDEIADHERKLGHRVTFAFQNIEALYRCAEAKKGVVLWTFEA